MATTGAIVRQCNCKHDGQDRIHGKGNRVHNRMVGGKTGNKEYERCTVCLNQKPPKS